MVVVRDGISISSRASWKLSTERKGREREREREKERERERERKRRF